MRNISCLVSPIRNHAFFEQAVFEGEIGDDLLQGLRLAPKVLHLVGGRSTRRVAGEGPSTGLQELLRPAIVHRRGDPLAAAELGYALLATKPFQYDADRVFRRLLLRPGFLTHLRSLRLR